MCGRFWQLAKGAVDGVGRGVAWGERWNVRGERGQGQVALYECVAACARLGVLPRRIFAGARADGVRKPARVRGGGKEGVVAEAVAAKARLAHLFAPPEGAFCELTPQVLQSWSIDGKVHVWPT